MPLNLKTSGLLRLDSIIAPDGPIPVSRSCWYRGIAEGRFPKPVYLGPRIACWRSDDIKALIEHGVGSGNDPVQINRTSMKAVQHG